MKISVIILHLSGLQDTRSCIRSLLRDGYRGEREILVWDNGSIDRDGETLRREFGDTIRVERSEKNFGYAGGNNRAARLAEGDILVFLNNDTEVTPGWLEPLVSELQSDPSIVACQPKLKFLSDHAKFDYAGGSGGFLDCLGFSYTRGRIVASIETDEGQYDDPMDIDWASGACFATRRSDFLESGGFDESFFAYSEEIDLCLRWRRKGRRIRSVPSSVVYHRSGTTWRNRQHSCLYYKHRNSLLMLMKNVSLMQLMWLLPVRFMLEIVASGYYLSLSNISCASAPIRSLFSAMLLLPSALARRGSDPPVRLWRRSVLVQYFLFGRKTFSALKPSVRDECQHDQE